MARLSDRIEPAELIGRKVLIGITREAADGRSSQEQYAGIAAIRDGKEFCLVDLHCDDGEVRSYPFDSRTLERAQRGEYRLRGTGQTVINPDFLMTWIVTKD